MRFDFWRKWRKFGVNPLLRAPKIKDSCSFLAVISTCRPYPEPEQRGPGVPAGQQPGSRWSGPSKQRDAAFCSAERFTFVGQRCRCNHVAVGLGCSIKAVSNLVSVLYLINNDCALDACVGQRSASSVLPDRVQRSAYQSSHRRLPLQPEPQPLR